MLPVAILDALKIIWIRRGGGFSLACEDFGRMLNHYSPLAVFVVVVVCFLSGN